MRLFLLLCAWAVAVSASGQSRPERAVVDVALPAGQYWYSAPMPVPLHAPAPFFAYAARWEGALAQPLRVRFSADGRDWTPWQPLERDAHNTEAQVSELGFAEPEMGYYQLVGSAATEVSVALHFYSPGHTPDLAAGESAPTAPAPDGESSLACPCPMPAAIGRDQWCPGGNCPPNPSPSTTQVTHLIVHHSAGVNTSGDWAAVVRSYWDFHVNTNGWADIGYNWLIDPDGKMYTGRGDNILGAHFCGHNGGTMGVCVMGNFTSITPTTQAIGKLVDLLAWKACNRNIDPFGEAFHNSSGFVVPNIGGHRDGCATACPGDAFYPMLPGVRQQTFNRIVAGCSGLAGPTQLSATPLTATDYNLNWTDNADNETGFLLERALGAAAFTPLANLPANTTLYAETGLDLGAVYRYRVRSYAGPDTSAYSNVVQIGPLTTTRELLPDHWLQLSPNPAQNQLWLQWNDAEAAEYDIQILDAAQRVWKQDQTAKPALPWRHSIEVSGLPPGVYWLRLRTGGRTGLWQWVKS